MQVMEDYNLHLLRSIIDEATRLADNEQYSALADYAQAATEEADAASDAVEIDVEGEKIKVATKDFQIVGQDGSKYLVYLTTIDYFASDGSLSWESRAVVAQHLASQLEQWESIDSSNKKNIFDEFLEKVRAQDEHENNFYPGEIDIGEIKKAVQFCLPSELAMHAISEGTKTVIKAINEDDIDLQFDIDQIGKLMRETRSTSTFATMFVTVVLEYMTSETLKLAGKCARVNGSSWITPSHVRLLDKEGDTPSRVRLLDVEGEVDGGDGDGGWMDEMNMSSGSTSKNKKKNKNKSDGGGGGGGSGCPWPGYFECDGEVAVDGPGLDRVTTKTENTLATASTHLHQLITKIAEYEQLAAMRRPHQGKLISNRDGGHGQPPTHRWSCCGHETYYEYLGHSNICFVGLSSDFDNYFFYHKTKYAEL